MSTSYRDPPKWATNATIEAESKMLANLEAGAALMRLIVKAARVNLDAILEAEQEAARGSQAAARDEAAQDGAASEPQAATREPQAAAGEPQAATREPQARRRWFPRVHAPQMVALGYRAGELLIELAPIIRERSVALVRAGIDPRPILQRAASMEVAHVFLNELGIDLENLDQMDHERLLAALRVVQGWIRECKREPIVYLRTREEGPRSGPREAFAAGHAAWVKGAQEPDPLMLAKIAELMKKLAKRNGTCVPKPKAKQAAAKPEAAGETPASPGRQAAPYAAGPDKLDWTKL